MNRAKRQGVSINDAEALNFLALTLQLLLPRLALPLPLLDLLPILLFLLKGDYVIYDMIFSIII
jgi:hypothetical protein